jgi:hypothetical protein
MLDQPRAIMRLRQLLHKNIFITQAQTTKLPICYMSYGLQGIGAPRRVRLGFMPRRRSMAKKAAKKKAKKKAAKKKA